MESGLYLVGTPIGNIGDITARAIDTLRCVDIIYAEDTRRTGVLLRRLDVDSELRSLHEHNEMRRCDEITSRLAQGGSCALVSDAGTPVISDPGQRVVEAVIEAGQKVLSVPGPSAILSALTVSGIDAARFSFVGFAPRSGRARTDWFRTVEESGHTIVAFESPKRLAATLDKLCARGAGNREAAVCRELTKKFEETRRGTVAELSEYYRDTEPRGEVTLVLAGRPKPAADPVAAHARARELSAAGHTVREVTGTLRDELGLSRNDAYRIALRSISSERATSEPGDEGDSTGGGGGVQSGR